MGSSWNNDDGLVVRFGTRVGADNQSSTAITEGNLREIVIDIDDATTIGASPGTSIHPDILEITNAPVIPSGAFIKAVTIYVGAAFTAAGSAVLDVGLYNPDTLVGIDDDGFALEAKAQLTINAVVDADATGSPAYIGTVTGADGKVGVTVTSGAFTAGSAKVVIQYVING